MAVTRVRAYTMPARHVPTYTRRIENTPTRVTKYYVGKYDVPAYNRRTTASKYKIVGGQVVRNRK